MREWVAVLIACSACGNELGKSVEKVNDLTAELGAQTEAVCYLAERLTEPDAEIALGEHAHRILRKPQPDKAALNAQLDCIAKGVASSRTYLSGLTNNLIRAYAKHPSGTVKEVFAMVSEENRRKQVGEYLWELALRDEDVREAAEVTPGLLEAMDQLGLKTYVSAGLAVLYARTDHPALKARFDAAPADKVAGAWGQSLDLIERGPEADREKLVQKLFAYVESRGIEFDRAAPCRLAPKLAGCDAALKAKAEADARAEANTSPIVAILQPVNAAAASAGQPSVIDTFQAERDGTAPSPVHAPVIDVPEMATAVDKLVALGESIAQDCRLMMSLAGPGGLVCARALGKIKLGLLTEATLAALAEYNAAYAKEGRKAHRQGHGVVAGLRALMEHEDKAADEVFLQSLSTYDPELAKYVMAKVKERAAMEQVVDGLFQFMARKDRFAVAEIDSYVGLLTSYGAPVTAPIVKNLERELAKAKRPEKVFWAHKVVALFALEQCGSAAAKSILDKYAADTSGYLDQKTASERGPAVSSQQVPFADVVARAKKAVASR